MIDPHFSFNLISDFADMWRYPFVQHAFEAGTLIAIVAGVIGYFVILRRSSFAAHGLSHAGFTGAAGAVLLGIDPIFGLFAFTMSGALLMASLGKRARSLDIEIGVVLAFMLGLGVLFISLYKGYATEVYSLLFGEILGISMNDVWVTLIAGVVVLVFAAALYRPLLFASLDPEVAEAKGVPTFFLGIAFMLLLAAAISIAVQAVGVLLIFSLLVTPAAIAERLATRPSDGIFISVSVALLSVWIGLFVSFYLPYPVSFFITTITFGIYLLVRISQFIHERGL
jgi:zinc/manganese transport system permease protein